jgi:hypothetical protein
LHSNAHVWLMLSSPDACLIIIRVSIACYLRLGQNLMHTHYRIHCKMHQARYMTAYKGT